jgi:methionyl aminopeptidase
MTDHEDSKRSSLTAGKVAADALSRAREMVHEDMPVRELCEKVEMLLFSQGCEPSFPVNVSVDSIAAHDTASLADNEIVIPKHAVVKIDVGAHHQGYISDTALTVSFNPEAERLVKAAEGALEHAISALRPDVQISQVSSMIERTIRSYSVNPVVDLTGHTIERYRLHAGVSIPNVSTRGGAKLSPGMVFAIEPFATFGIGEIDEDSVGKIYSGIKRVRSPIKFDERVMEYAIKQRKGMPFSDRWLANAGRSEDVLASIRRLVRFGSLYEYKVLKEKSGGLVSQFEHTVYMDTDGPIITTRRD